MADLNGSNDNYDDATRLGVLTYGQGGAASFQVADSTGLFSRIGLFNVTPGDDPLDVFSFTPSGVGTATVRFNADSDGNFANLLFVVPVSGVTHIDGAGVGTWYGGRYVSASTDQREFIDDVSEESLDAIRNGEFDDLENPQAITWHRQGDTATAEWTLNGDPVIFEVVAYQVGDNFINSFTSTARLVEANYTLEIEASGPALPGYGFENAADYEQTFVGTSGLDFYDFRGSYSDFVLQGVDGDRITLSSAQAPGAIDALSGIERIAFKDGFLAFDTTGTAGQTYRLYEAAFNREPDLEGLGHWIKGYDAGHFNLVEMAEAFLQSQEFTNLYGSPDNLSDADFLTQLYANILDREPDLAGFNFWSEQQSNGLARAEILRYFSESTENYANLAGEISDGIFYI